MIIALSCNNLECFNKFVKYYSDDTKNCRFIVTKLDETNYTYDDLSKVMIENGIKDFTLINTSEIINKLPNVCKNEFLKFLNNVIGICLSPWYINKYICNNEDIFFAEEDMIIRLTKDYIDMLSKQDKNLAYMFGSWSAHACDDTPYGYEWCKVQNIEPTYINCYSDVVLRHVCGGPLYFKYNSFEGYDEYIERVFTNFDLYKILKRSKGWHHRNFDEWFKSCSPVIFNNFDRSVLKSTFVGERGLDSFNPKYSNCWNNCIIHLAGINKYEKLNIVINNLR